MFVFLKRKTGLRVAHWDLSSDVCSSDLTHALSRPAFRDRVGSVCRQHVVTMIDADDGSTPTLISHASYLRDYVGDLAGVIDMRRSRRGDRRWASTAAPVSATGRRSRSLRPQRSEEHTSELQSLMRTSYAVFCLTKKKNNINKKTL